MILLEGGDRMAKIEIISGFLGAGKTTLIRKLLKEAYQGEKCVLIENEFGEIGIDGAFLKDSGIAIRELISGCICCSLVGDFGKAMKDVEDQYHPDHIIIEPSGVGKLSDVIAAVQKAAGKEPRLVLNTFTTMAKTDIFDTVFIYRTNRKRGFRFRQRGYKSLAGVQCVFSGIRPRFASDPARCRMTSGRQ